MDFDLTLFGFLTIFLLLTVGAKIEDSVQVSPVQSHISVPKPAPAPALQITEEEDSDLD